MSFSTTEFAINQYRSRTEKHSASMAGIASRPITFNCQCCGKSKETKGRKMVIKGAAKFGYYCADCIENGLSEMRKTPKG